MTAKGRKINCMYHTPLAISFCLPTSTCKHLNTKDAFCTVGLIKAYFSLMSCTCWRYSLAILQASKINFNVNITHFDKVMYIIWREIYLYRHIELYFIKVFTLCTLYYFIRNIWLNYILSKGNIWEIDCRITRDHCLKCEVILHSCVVTFISVHRQSLLEFVPSGCIHLFLYCGTKLSSKNIHWLCIRLIWMLCGGEF